MPGKAGQEERVEDAAGPRHDHLPGLMPGKRGLIDPGMHQRIKGICQSHHMHLGRNAFARQPVGIAGAVPTFMVVAAHIADGRECLALPQLRNPLQQVTALGGMGFHYLILLFGQ